MGEDLFDMESEIACQDIPSHFSRYYQDIQLSQQALRASLKTVTELLKNLPKDQAQIIQIAEEIEEAEIRLQANEMALAIRAEDIEYFLKDCIKTKE